jgi:hypothetical protein
VTLNGVSSTTGTIGQVIAISETPAGGYTFVGWTVTDDSDADWTSQSLTSSTAAGTNLTIPDMGSTPPGGPVPDMNLTVTANYTSGVTGTLSVTAATSTTWVYQNTPSTTYDRHSVALNINVTDTWGNSNYTVTVTQTGPGVVTPTQTFTSSATLVLVPPTGSAPVSWAVPAAGNLSGYLVGGRTVGWVNSTANLNETGNCTVTVTVLGDKSGLTNPAVSAPLTLLVRPLGDVLNEGPINSLDANEFVNWLDGHRGDTSTLDPEVFDVDGGGNNLSSLQLNLLILMLNGHTIP